ncbi:hypothetical protein ACA910_006133 [Epithemia clementina (nom. ined.)]
MSYAATFVARIPRAQSFSNTKRIVSTLFGGNNNPKIKTHCDGPLLRSTPSSSNDRWWNNIRCGSNTLLHVAPVTPNDNDQNFHDNQENSAAGGATTATTTARVQENVPSISSSLACGLLFSSFSDGIQANAASIADVLQRGLVQSVLMQQQADVEAKLQQSALQSPCCGPNLQYMDQLAAVDDKLRQNRQGFLGTYDFDPNLSLTSPWSLLLDNHHDDDDSLGIVHNDGKASTPFSLRVMYIPTALYALRSESTNTPGKQRQRARADGKQRRNEWIQFLQGQVLGTFHNTRAAQIQVVTVDLHDDSVKQPEQVLVGRQQQQHDDNKTKSDKTWVPQSGTQALEKWRPHLIYVEGGNTFWLHHCMEKGNYRQLLTRAVTTYGALYCGKSAGAILAGASMATACWKQWDNPTIVPGRESYDEWKTVTGLNVVGRNASIFPHMSDEWQDVVTENSPRLDPPHSVICLLEDDVLCVLGGDVGAVGPDDMQLTTGIERRQQQDQQPPAHWRRFSSTAGASVL